jgi:hypothetical protein
MGDGKLPDDVRIAITGEGVVFLEEGLRGSITYKHYRAPGRRYGSRIEALIVGLGVSDQRVVVFARSGRTRLVDVPYADPRSAALTVSADGEKVAIAVDLDRFGTPDISGNITIRATTPNAAAIVESLRQRLDAAS